jgi:hypothetical protein
MLRIRLLKYALANLFLRRASALLLLVAFSVIAQASEMPKPIQPAGIISRIERQPVKSRALAAIGYSRRLRALEIEFKRGGTYRYLDVPRSVYDELLAAESKAGFYNRNIRGKYRSVYVRPRRTR